MLKVVCAEFLCSSVYPFRRNTVGIRQFFARTFGCLVEVRYVRGRPLMADEVAVIGEFLQPAQNLLVRPWDKGLKLVGSKYFAIKHRLQDLAVPVRYVEWQYGGVRLCGHGYTPWMLRLLCL
jgi:hypothetical protein